MECPICWDSLVSASMATVSIPCGHLFHEKCLSPYLMQRAGDAETGLPDCPTCREPIKLMGGHDLARIPCDLHALCLPAVRRVYVAGRDADAGETARELDWLYARVAQLQHDVQQAREKETSAEGRVAAIMDLWKKEQVKVADLQRRLQHALLAQQNTQGVKAAEPRPSAPTQQPKQAASHAPGAPAADSADQWRQLDEQMVMHPSQLLPRTANWGALPVHAPPPPPAAQQWHFHGQQQQQMAAPSMQDHRTNAEMRPTLHPLPAAPVAVVTHPVHSYQAQMLPSGSPSGSAPPPPQMMPHVAHPHLAPYAAPSPAAPPEMVYAAPPIAQAYAHPVAPQASGSGAASRTRHLTGPARERALEDVRLQQQQRWMQQQQQQQQQQQSQRALQAYRQQQDAAALARMQQAGPPWAGPSA